MFIAPQVADATLPDVLADTMVVRKGEILYVSHVTWPSCTCKNTFPLDDACGWIEMVSKILRKSDELKLVIAM